MTAWACCALAGGLYLAHSPSLRAQRSNPWPRAGRSAMDCFVAAAPRNDGSGVLRSRGWLVSRPLTVIASAAKQSMAPRRQISNGLRRRCRASQGRLGRVALSRVAAQDARLEASGCFLVACADEVIE